MIRIGVDLGGTKIEAIALAEDGRELARKRLPTPREDYRATIEAIRALVGDVERAAGERAARIGIGTPGAISPATGLIKNANSTWLNGRPFDRDLEASLGRPVRLANDANCLAVSEAVDGAGAGADVVFAVILGTGVGGGIVAHGRVIEGAHRIAGEWGHNPLPGPRDDERPGPACYCGRSGCIETFLSGPGLARDYAGVAAGARRSAEKAVPAEEVVRRAGEGDAAASAALARYEDRLARALASVINVLDPDVIVLGGGMSNVQGLLEAVPSAWGKYVFSDQVATRLARAKHGDSSGVRGAAWLWG